MALILIPQVVFAHDFLQNNGTFFNANNALYRQKTDTRPWQLTSLPEHSTIKQSVSFDGQIWLVVEVNAKQYLYRQNRSLDFSVVTDVASTSEIVLKQTASNLIVWRQNGGEVGLTIFRPGGQFESVVSPLLNGSNDLTRVVESNGDLLYLQQTGSEVAVFQMQHGWQLSTHFNCDQSRLIETPIIGVYCQDGSIVRLLASDQWATLNLAPVRDSYWSGEILAGWDRVDSHTFYIWRSDVVTDIQLPTLNATEVEQTVVSGSRILFKKIGSNWQELLWQLDVPKLVELTDTSSGAIVPVVGADNLMINGAVPQFSSVAGTWQLVTTVGTFDTARQTPTGVLIWNTGSLTQFAPTGSTTFAKVNPWSSTTSPIQAIQISPNTSFVSVITQSGTGNTNLYKTTDFIHWSRITLPTVPTFSPTIGQARALPAGSLVELSGVITVAPKVVDSEILYLEDASGGIQVYLSQTSGLLPTTTEINTVATGEISTSQAKRVLLGSLNDLELGNTANWSQPTVSVDEAGNYLGRSVGLKGAVTDTDTDYLTLEGLKLHFASAKTVFQPNDQLIVPAVIDWNSASGKNEAWALSTDYQLLSRVQPTVATGTATTQNVTTVPKKTVVAKKAAASTSSSQTIPSATETVQTADTTVIVADAQSNTDDNHRTISMSVVSLLAGLVSFRGKRFRRFLPN